MLILMYQELPLTRCLSTRPNDRLTPDTLILP